MTVTPAAPATPASPGTSTAPTPNASLAPLTERLAAGKTYRPRTLDTIRITDKDLHLVLEGRRHLLFDGGMGTMLQAAGMAAGEVPELLNLTNPEVITRVPAAYVEAGSEVVTTNTFGANALKLGDAASVEDVFTAAVQAARAAHPRYVAADIGPIGALLRPLGTLSFDEAYALFAQQARVAEQAGADLIVIETMTDLLEVKAAALAAKECTNLPVIATMTFEADGRTFLGTSPEIAAASLDALGVDALGINCSLGPREIRPFAQRMLAVTNKPLIIQANAGLPRVENGRTVYDITPEDYAEAVGDIIADGAGIVGGCCGTPPAYIRLLAQKLGGHKPEPRQATHPFTCTSAQKLITLDGRRIAVIGERINPTGKKKLQAALRAGDLAYIVGQGHGKAGMATVCIGAIANIVLDPLFIYTFRMGVAGAAVATVASQLIGGVVCLLYVSKHYEVLKMTREDFKINVPCIKRLLSMGLPMALQTSITAIGSVILLPRLYGRRQHHSGQQALYVLRLRL